MPVNPPAPTPEQRRRTPGAIRRMFDGVAPGYDRMNRVLSLGLDEGWRRRAAAELDAAPGSRVLDLCCGTGDLALALPDAARRIGCDFSPAMLSRAREKSRQANRVLHLAAGDAMALPFRPGAVDGVTIGFGYRNLPDRPAALAGIRRVLRAGGRLVVLEFSNPPGRLAGFAHRVWLRRMTPLVGRLAASGGEPYAYLKDSILEFPKPEEILGELADAGFSDPSFRPLSLGAVAVYSASA